MCVCVRACVRACSCHLIPRVNLIVISLGACCVFVPRSLSLLPSLVGAPASVDAASAPLAGFAARLSNTLEALGVSVFTGTELLRVERATDASAYAVLSTAGEHLELFCSVIGACVCVCVCVCVVCVCVSAAVRSSCAGFVVSVC